LKEAKKGLLRVPSEIEWNSNPRCNKEWFEQVTVGRVHPRIEGIRCSLIYNKEGTGNIFLIDVPKSPISPHMSDEDKRYYQRIGARSEPMEHYQVEYCFGRRLKPDLVPEMDISPISRGSSNGFAIQLTLHNKGRAIAKLPYCSTKMFGTVSMNPENVYSPSKRPLAIETTGFVHIDYFSYNDPLFSDTALQIFYTQMQVDDYAVVSVTTCAEEAVTKNLYGLITRDYITMLSEGKPSWVKLPLFKQEDFEAFIETSMKVYIDPKKYPIFLSNVALALFPPPYEIERLEWLERARRRYL
jgi:hypothetical protein